MIKSFETRIRNLRAAAESAPDDSPTYGYRATCWPTGGCRWKGEVRIHVGMQPEAEIHRVECPQCGMRGYLA